MQLTEVAAETNAVPGADVDSPGVKPATVPGIVVRTAGGCVTVIEPQGGWRLLNLGELWRYRELLLTLAIRDVQVRYKQTMLGAAWAVLQPLLMMGIFTIVLGRLAHLPSGNLPYSLFVFAGLLPWTFFNGAVSRAGMSVVGS